MTTQEDGWFATTRALYRTTDGGSHWTDETPPASQNMGVKRVVASFLGPSRAWVAPIAPGGGKDHLFKTTNGGTSWTDVGTFQGVISMSFPNPKHGWIMESDGMGAGQMAVTVLRTSDGGASWTAIVNPPSSKITSENAQGLPVGGYKGGLVFTTPAVGLITGSSHSYLPYIFITTDGGKRWTPEKLPYPNGKQRKVASVSLPVFKNTRYGYLMASMWDGTDVYYKTTDRGRSWTIMGERRETGAPFDFTWILDSTHWWNWRRHLYSTSDSGKHWRLEQTPNPNIDLPSSPIATVQFVSPKLGWLVSQRQNNLALYRSADGGKHWTQLHTWIEQATAP